MSDLSRSEPRSEYPEHDKLCAIEDRSNAIGEFLDYGASKLGLVLCEEPNTRRNQSRWPCPTSRSISSVLAAYFGIDEVALEVEKRAMLEAMRNAQS